MASNEQSIFFRIKSMFSGEGFIAAKKGLNDFGAALRSMRGVLGDTGAQFGGLVNNLAKGGIWQAGAQAVMMFAGQIKELGKAFFECATGIAAVERAHKAMDAEMSRTLANYRRLRDEMLKGNAAQKKSVEDLSKAQSAAAQREIKNLQTGAEAAKAKAEYERQLAIAAGGDGLKEEEAARKAELDTAYKLLDVEKRLAEQRVENARKLLDLADKDYEDKRAGGLAGQLPAAKDAVAKAEIELANAEASLRDAYNKIDAKAHADAAAAVAAENRKREEDAQEAEYFEKFHDKAEKRRQAEALDVIAGIDKELRQDLARQGNGAKARLGDAQDAARKADADLEAARQDLAAAQERYAANLGQNARWEAVVAYNARDARRQLSVGMAGRDRASVEAANRVADAAVAGALRDNRVNTVADMRRVRNEAFREERRENAKEISRMAQDREKADRLRAQSAKTLSDHDKKWLKDWEDLQRAKDADAAAVRAAQAKVKAAQDAQIAAAANIKKAVAELQDINRKLDNLGLK